MRRALALVVAGMLATPAAAQTSRERVVSSVELLADVFARGGDAELEVAPSLVGRGR